MSRDVFADYEAEFKQPPPMPFGIALEELERVVAEHLGKGEPIPNDYDWYDLPDDADA